MQPYKIYILLYAKSQVSESRFVLGDFHQRPIDLYFYLWVATNGAETVVVDMGFTEAMAKKRARIWLAQPAALFEQIKVNPATVKHVVISHLHWDHVGNTDLFPKATFYLQGDEMAFWTGKYIRYPVFNMALELDDVAALLRCNAEGRVQMLDGDREVLPGIVAHKVGGGHTKGIQMVTAQTASGRALIASDAAHLYRNFDESTPTQILYDTPAYVDGFGLMRELACDAAHFLPGHDRQVMQRQHRISEHIALLE